MKKIFKMAFLSLAMVLFITGCGMKAEYGIKIEKDKSVALEFLIAQDDEMIDAMIDMGNSMEEDDESDEVKTHTDKERWEYIDSSNDEDFKDYEKVKYDQNGYKGYTYKLRLGSIDELVKTDDSKVDIQDIDEDSKLFTKDGNTYKLSIKNSDDSNDQMNEYADTVNFDVKLIVTLPNKAESNNATEVNGTTYTWDLTKIDSIDLTFKLDGKSNGNSSTGDNKSNNNLILYIGIGAGAAVLIAVVIIVLVTKKKKA